MKIPSKGLAYYYHVFPSYKSCILLEKEEEEEKRTISNTLKCPLVAQGLIKGWELLLLLFIIFIMRYKWSSE